VIIYGCDLQLRTPVKHGLFIENIAGHIDRRNTLSMGITIAADILGQFGSSLPHKNATSIIKMLKIAL
jgi:hypothetical protein